MDVSLLRLMIRFVSEVTMFALLLSGWAFAQDIPTPPYSDVDLSTALSPAQAQKKGSASKGGKKGSKPSWKHNFYARPALSASTFTSLDGDSTSTAVGVGGEGGVRYREVGKPFPRLRGRTRATVQYFMSTDPITGMEVKVGSFMGPWWKYAGIETGLDVSWDRYDWDGVALDPTLGFGVPVIGTTGVNIGKKSGISVYAGFQPTFLSTEQRRVDWSETDEFGFGHQFSVMTGAHLGIDDLSVGVGLTRTVTATGVQAGYGLSFNLRG